MGVLDLAKGMGVTLGKLFSKPLTVSYPESRVQLKPRFRGRHVLTRHPDTGLEKCIGCSLCAAVVPPCRLRCAASRRFTSLFQS